MIDPVAAALEADFDAIQDAYLARQTTCPSCGRRLPQGVRHVQAATGSATPCRELTW